jgi:myo-inositol-1(or 4)-monophosphatase
MVTAPQETAERACRAAGALLLDGEGLRARTKRSSHDLVTEADLRAEEVITAMILDAHPDSRVRGEEGPERGDGALRWYVDPIDGTNNFVHGLPLFCVSVGAELDGELVAGCVHDPARGITFGVRDGALMVDGARHRTQRGGPLAVITDLPHGGRSPDAGELEFLGELIRDHDVRRIGSSALALAYVAAGWADAAFNVGVSPWDVAAGAHLVRAAGGVFHGLEHDGTASADRPWLAPVFFASRAAESPVRHRLADHLRSRSSST